MLQTHEKQSREHHDLALELGHVLVEAGEPEQAQGYFAPTSQNLGEDTKYKLHAASGQLRYHQWYQTWVETLENLNDERISPGR